MPGTAAVVIIGDEILSGQTEDVNSAYLAKELRDLGVKLNHIAVIPDNVEDISKTVKELSANYDTVFTSGGIGPTHDDVTMEGIARAFDVSIARDPEVEAMIKEGFKDSNTEAALKMADIPLGAEKIMIEGFKLPLVVFENVYVFPGIPEYLKLNFEAVKERFRGESIHQGRIYIKERESKIATLLEETEERFDVKIGSYPKVGKDMLVKVTIDSMDKRQVDRALQYIKDRLDPTVIIKIE